MTKATTLEPPPTIPDRTDAPISNRLAAWNSAAALFTMTLVRQARSRRALVLAALYLLPIAFVVLIRQNDSGWKGPHSGYRPRSPSSSWSST